MDDLISRQAVLKPYQTLDDSDTICIWLLRKNIEQTPSAQQWIPCNKKMPKEDHHVGLHYPHSEVVLMSIFKAIDNISLVDFGHTINGRWWSETCDCRVRNGWEVLAWMPLPQPYPQPYKGGQDG